MREIIPVDCEKPAQTQSHRKPSHPSSILRDVVLATVKAQPLRDFIDVPQGRYSLKPGGIQRLVRNADSSPIICTLHDPHGELEWWRPWDCCCPYRDLLFGDCTLASFSFMLQELSADSEVQAAPCFPSAVILYATRMHVVS